MLACRAGRSAFVETPTERSAFPMHVEYLAQEIINCLVAGHGPTASIGFDKISPLRLIEPRQHCGSVLAVMVVGHGRHAAITAPVPRTPGLCVRSSKGA